MTTAPADDRRAALKARHRRAIVDAAASLMEETGGTSFTVDQLADRASVSRRTVFNHFASMDDAVAEVLGDVIGAVAESLGAGPAASGAGAATPFRELAAALRATDMVTPMAYLTGVLGGPSGPSPARQAHLMSKVYAELSERLATQLLRRHPAADELTVHLLVGSVTSGLLVLHRHWSAATGAADNRGSRRLWTELLERLIETTETGFAADPSPPHAT